MPLLLPLPLLLPGGYEPRWLEGGGWRFRGRCILERWWGWVGGWLGVWSENISLELWISGDCLVWGRSGGCWDWQRAYGHVRGIARSWFALWGFGLRGGDVALRLTVGVI